MFKEQYIKALDSIDEITGRNGRFEFDMVLDGYYGFNMNEVAAFFELLNFVELINAVKGPKEPIFKYKNIIYRASRLEGDYESIVICRCSEGNDEAVIDEAELMEIINEKCMAKEQLYASQIKNSKKTGD